MGVAGWMWRRRGDGMHGRRIGGLTRPVLLLSVLWKVFIRVCGNGEGHWVGYE